MILAASVQQGGAMVAFCRTRGRVAIHTHGKKGGAVMTEPASKSKDAEGVARRKVAVDTQGRRTGFGPPQRPGNEAPDPREAAMKAPRIRPSEEGTGYGP